MSKTKFTKGEWELKPTGFHGEFNITTQDRLDDSKTSILTIDTDYTGYIGVEQKANAHLIAAPPDMYEMLASLLRHEIESVDTHNAVVDLLAKARGEQ